MTTVEKLALIFVIFSIIKIIVVSVNPKLWYGNANPLIKITAKKTNGIVFFLVFFAIVLACLLTELTIVQIFAATVFGFLLLMLSLYPYLGKIIELVVGDTKTGGSFWRKNWIVSIIWMMLLIWVIWELFFIV